MKCLKSVKSKCHLYGYGGGVVYFDGVKLYMRTAASNGHIVHPPDDIRA
jgi:hypothetical protein